MNIQNVLTSAKQFYHGHNLVQLGMAALGTEAFIRSAVDLGQGIRSKWADSRRAHLSSAAIELIHVGLAYGGMSTPTGGVVVASLLTYFDLRREDSCWKSDQ